MLDGPPCSSKIADDGSVLSFDLLDLDGVDAALNDKAESEFVSAAAISGIIDSLKNAPGASSDLTEDINNAAAGLEDVFEAKNQSEVKSSFGCRVRCEFGCCR